MRSLLRKELNSFFSHLPGYLTIVFFLLVNGLFLWVFDGNYNIFNYGTASLKPFFELAPWIFLFLIPASTMRVFAEEKKMGTLDLLLIRPLPYWKTVLAKSLASFLVIIITLLPTLLYFLTLSLLADPVNNIDAGATWGSFLGLLLLAAAYNSIGLFCSSITNNQIVAFLYAIVLSFCIYIGFDFISDQVNSTQLVNLLAKAGINEHYQSISRGVIDSRDIAYYLLVPSLFFLFTIISLQKHKNPFKILKKNGIVLLVILILGIFLIQTPLFRVDLTADQRHTLSEKSIQITKELDEAIYAEIYLHGELPYRLKNLKKSLIEKIEEYNAINKKKIFYQLIDPYKDIQSSERNEFFKYLMDNGINPIDLRMKNKDGESVKRIFPGMIVSGKEKAIALNLLSNDPNVPADINLNRSVELLEFNITRALQFLNTNQKPIIGFLQGHKEANRYETADLALSLSERYSTRYIESKELMENDSIELLMVINPREAFSDFDKLAIDQFIMKGGKAIFAIDPITVHADSLMRHSSTLALISDINIKDLFFRYGIRYTNNLVKDVRCMKIPVISNAPGQSNNFVPANWVYFPLAAPSNLHSLSKNLGLVSTQYAGTIDTIGHKEKMQRTILLESSEFSRAEQAPTLVSLEEINTPPDPQYYNQKKLPLGVLAEGTFHSLYANRPTESMGMNKKDLLIESIPTKMIFLSDANILMNNVRWKNNQPLIDPLGHDRYTGQTYSNKDFAVNMTDYLLDEMGIVSLRNNTFKIRPLNQVKVQEQKLKWQLINVLLPIVAFIFFGLVKNVIRNRRYSK